MKPKAIATLFKDHMKVSVVLVYTACLNIGL